jgi:AraC-like DNA-binding protein
MPNNSLQVRELSQSSPARIEINQRGPGSRCLSNSRTRPGFPTPAARLADPAQDHLPVLTIALDCGYGSIGPFNRAFKARFGVTPSQYRNLRATEAAVSEIGQLSR